MNIKESLPITGLGALASLADYSLMDALNCDPDATANGIDHSPRQVFSGHYVPVRPTPIENPEYVTHSKQFFKELGLADSLATSNDFMQVFSGDLSQAPEPMRRVGWATGYALSIFGTEYIHQCPFQTGNGYGDGRAVSVFEGLFNGQRFEMQLKGGGRTPYCRGADGRAVLRSSVREFLAQEHMHSLGVPSSRSLSLYVSKSETVNRPWYSQGTLSKDPDMMVSESVAISTRVAPSFIRVGQLELFARRARKNEHPNALQELEKIVLHAIDREYADQIDSSLNTPKKVVALAQAFSDRLTSLVASWIRVGFCQGNFNSDNCAVGGFTLDYGPFGYIEAFDPYYQSWTGGGQHFSFLNQPVAALRNFETFCSALRPLLNKHDEELLALDDVQRGFSIMMQTKLEKMWASKLGLSAFDSALVNELITLMTQTPVDYTIFFRELSGIPDDITALKKSFYQQMGQSSRAAHSRQASDNDDLEGAWTQWFSKWKGLLNADLSNSKGSVEALSKQMKLINPKYTLREWLVAPAYQQAAQGNYSLLRELQEIMTQPYAEQSKETSEKYYSLKPLEVFDVGGVSHYSCSS